MCQKTVINVIVKVILKFVDEFHELSYLWMLCESILQVF